MIPSCDHCGDTGTLVWTVDPLAKLNKITCLCKECSILLKGASLEMLVWRKVVSSVVKNVDCLESRREEMK